MGGLEVEVKSTSLLPLPSIVHVLNFSPTYCTIAITLQKLAIQALVYCTTRFAGTFSDRKCKVLKWNLTLANTEAS